MTKTFKKLIMTLLLILGMSSAYAGSGHSHDASESLIINNAKYELLNLIKKGKFNKTWKNAKRLNIIKQGFFSNKEWVVSFKNDSVKNISKQIVYIYFTSYGKFKGVNYKGN